jgi:hypothetical protein
MLKLTTCQVGMVRPYASRNLDQDRASGAHAQATTTSKLFGSTYLRAIT